jgi:hypothetical protein
MKLPALAHSYKGRGESHCYSHCTFQGWRLWILLLKTIMMLNLCRRVIGFVARNVMSVPRSMGWCGGVFHWSEDCLLQTLSVAVTLGLTVTPSVPPVLKASTCGGIFFSLAVSGGVFMHSRWTTRSPRCCRNSPTSVDRGRRVVFLSLPGDIYLFGNEAAGASAR